MALTLKDYAAQFRDPLRQGVVETLWASSTIIPLLTFITWLGMTYPYTKRTKRPGVGTRSLNAAFSVSPGTNAPDVETLAILGGEVRSDSVMMQLKPNTRLNEIAATIESAALMFDRLFINGDPTATGHANEFYGLKARITATSQLVDMATDGALPTYKKVSELQDKVKGPNSAKVLLMNRTTRRLLSEDVKTNAGGKGVFDVGQQLASYDNSKIVELEKDETDAEIIPFTEIQGASGAACASVYCARFGGNVDEQDVQGIAGGGAEMVNHMDVGLLGTYYSDIVQMIAGIGVFGPYSCARLRGVKAA